MRDKFQSFLGCLVACGLAASASAQPADDSRFETFINAANSRRDCSGYPAMATSVLAGRPGGYLGDRLNVAVTICAARDGQFDIANRLIAYAKSTPQDSGLESQTRFGLYYLIQQLSDIPRAGEAAFAASLRLARLQQGRSFADVELSAMAEFAAGHDDLGVENLDEIDRRGALSIQVDRRFAPAWLAAEELAVVVDRPLKWPYSTPGERWTRDLAVLSRESDETVVLSSARRFLRVETPSPFDRLPKTLWRMGDGRLAWLVQRLIEDGRIDEARETINIETTGKDGQSDDYFFVLGLTGVVEGLIRADRAADARKLLEWWSAAQEGERPKYVHMPWDDVSDFWPLRALQACLQGDHTARLEATQWRTSLTCDDPQDRTAALLIEGLQSPVYRSQVLQAVNMPLAYPAQGRNDEDYRKRWDALMARPDVAAAINRYGRRLPPDLAWRLSRAYPAF